MARTPKQRRLRAPQPAQWVLLKRGKTLAMLVHPSTVDGFVRTSGMEPHGQVEDWVRSMPDGSRLHAHVYADGRIAVHRDRWDPARGPLSTAAHVALETTAGRMALGFAAVRLLGWL